MGVSSSKPHTVATKWFPDFEAKLPDLTDKTIAITGCTSGTGLIVARTAVRKGAKNVLMLNRPSERAEAAEAAMKEEDKDNKSHIETIPCDLMDFDSVKSAATSITAKYEAVDVLCNNAGVMALEDKATGDGYDVQMQTNHLSHFLLTKELYPLLQRAAELRGEARVVNHSSLARSGPGGALDAKYLEKNGGHLGGNGNSMFFGGARWKRYHQTKLANSVFTLALADRFQATGSQVKAAVAAPGLAATNLQVTTNAQGGMDSMWVMRTSQSAEDGAMPVIAACFDPSTENGDFWEPANMGHFRGPAVKVQYDKLSKNEDSRKMLWEKSEEACGKFDIS